MRIRLSATELRSNFGPTFWSRINCKRAIAVLISILECDNMYTYNVPSEGLVYIVYVQYTKNVCCKQCCKQYRKELGVNPNDHIEFCSISRVQCLDSGSVSFDRCPERGGQTLPW